MSISAFPSNGATVIPYVLANLLNANIPDVGYKWFCSDVIGIPAREGDESMHAVVRIAEEVHRH